MFGVAVVLVQKHFSAAQMGLYDDEVDVTGVCESGAGA